MANKREFKKYVNAVCESIINDMMTAYYHVEEVDKTAVEAAVADILMATENAILKSGIKFDKTARICIPQCQTQLLQKPL